MCKKTNFNKLRAAISAVALGLLCSVSAPQASAALACLRCPTDAVGPAVGGAFDVYVMRNGVAVRVTGSTIGICETNLILRAQLNYSPQATGGGVGAGFTGGRYRWRLIERGATLVNELVPGDPTPANVDTVLVTDLLNPLTTCTPPLGFTAVQFEPMVDIVYHITAADAAAGFLQFFFDASTLPQALLTNQFGNCVEHVSPAGTPSVFIAPPVTCTPPTAQRICVGSSATFTTTAGGSGPFTYCWQKGCPGAGACLSTAASLTINNAQASDGGCYTVTVTDQFGCVTTCQVNLTVVSPPSCVISPAGTCVSPLQRPAGSSVTFTITVTAGANENSANLSTTVTANGVAVGGSPFAGAGAHTFTVTTPNFPDKSCIAATVVDTSLPATACTSTCEAAVQGVCTPHISVIKDVTCFLPAGCPAEASTAWAKSATGAVNRVTGEFPSFCYRFKACNDGTCPLTITSATDLTPNGSSAGIDISGCGFVGTVLQPGTCTSFCVVSPVELRADLTNIFCVSATGGGTTVSACDTNRVVLKPVSIICAKTVSVDGGAPANSAVLTPGAPHSLVYTVCYTNTGTLPLTGITITDPTLGISTSGVDLAPGEGACFTAPAITVECPTNINNTATVAGLVDTVRSGVCAFERNGTQIGASTTCEASISCSTPSACRVTGGGRQDQSTDLGNGQKTINVDPVATPFSANLVAKWVTHGGQVGAPVGTATEWDPASPCIKGEWEHVRHFRPGLDGNFHARSFDSLQCACLACLGDPGSGTIVPGKKGGLCNPGDRLCGPEPRRAPANKICFSGVGAYTTDNGRNGRRTPNSVAFRVDIEDHSEPGGSGPKGNKRLPADRYRIRIFALSGDKDNNANIAIRMAIACTAANTGLRDGTTDPLAADGVTTPLHSAFNGIVPSVDDGGELDRGNHQIHPQIKDCP